MNVRTYGNLGRALGERFKVDIQEGATIWFLASKIKEKMGKTKNGFLRDLNLSDSTFTILVNGRNIKALSKLDTKLKEGDTVTIIPLVVGG